MMPSLLVVIDKGQVKKKGKKYTVALLMIKSCGAIEFCECDN